MQFRSVLRVVFLPLVISGCDDFEPSVEGDLPVQYLAGTVRDEQSLAFLVGVVIYYDVDGLSISRGAVDGQGFVVPMTRQHPPLGSVRFELDAYQSYIIEPEELGSAVSDTFWVQVLMQPVTASP